VKRALTIITGLLGVCSFCAWILFAQWLLPHAPTWMQLRHDGEVVAYALAPGMVIAIVSVSIVVVSIALAFCINEDSK
jgi:hypothetical protein